MSKKRGLIKCAWLTAIMMMCALFYGVVPVAAKAPAGTYEMRGSVYPDYGSVTTKDGNFIISVKLSNGITPRLEADDYGLYIDYSTEDEEVEIELEFRPTGTWDFIFMEAIIGEFSENEIPGNNQFSDIYLAGYVGDVKVCQTSPYSSIDQYEEIYGIDYSDCIGKKMDRFVIHFIAQPNQEVMNLNFESPLFR